jgi:hypothetical protein
VIRLTVAQAAIGSAVKLVSHCAADLVAGQHAATDRFEAQRLMTVSTANNVTIATPA